MNGYTKMAFAPMTSEKGANGYPVYGDFIKLNTLEKLNNVAIKLTPKKQTTTRKADNQVEETETETGYDVTATVYDYDEKAATDVFGDELDANKNIVMKANTPPIHGCLFFEAKDGNRVSARKQFYLYDVALSRPEISTQTFDGGDVPTIDITGKGQLLLVGGKYLKGACVKEGNEGFVDGELPASVYFPVETVSAGGEGNV